MRNFNWRPWSHCHRARSRSFHRETPNVRSQSSPASWVATAQTWRVSILHPTGHLVQWDSILGLLLGPKEERSSSNWDYGSKNYSHLYLPGATMRRGSAWDTSPQRREGPRDEDSETAVPGFGLARREHNPWFTGHYLPTFSFLWLVQLANICYDLQPKRVPK